MFSNLFRRGDAARQSAAELRLREAITAQRRFLYVRVYDGYRHVEFLPDGTIGDGASALEQTWTVASRRGKPVLRIGGAKGATCELGLADTGVLSGRELKFRGRLVLLLPQAGGAAFKPKISFYTTCMGRLHHLRETMPANLRAALDYGNVEFVLLNYNSPDALDDWARAELSSYIERGVVNYYKTSRPTRYDSSRAKNLAARLATGDIICNLDADNWLGYGFAEHLAQLCDAPRTVVRPHDGHNSGGASGRLAMFNADFIALGGYDESFTGFGWDELDLFNRARAAGFLARRYDPKFSLCLSHSNAEREMHIGLNKDQTSAANHRQSTRNISQGILVANAGKPWGQEPVLKNFSERIAA